MKQTKTEVMRPNEPNPTFEKEKKASVKYVIGLINTNKKLRYVVLNLYLGQEDHFEHHRRNFCKPRHIHLRFLLHKPPCHLLTDVHTWNNPMPITC